MPQVGKNNYGYDKKGKAAAAADSAKTGNPVVSTKKKKKKKEGPVERGRRLKKDRMSDEKSDRDEFYAQNPHSVLPSGEGSHGRGIGACCWSKLQGGRCRVLRCKRCWQGDPWD